jgi:regulator of protease activity HflC (stomatin/prohibitin superfamily)
MPLRRAALMLRRLAIATGATLALAALVLAFGPMLRGFTDLHAVSATALRTGAAGAAFAAGLLALAGEAACWAMLRNGRRRGGLGAKRAQGSLVPGLALLAGLAAWRLAPVPTAPAPQDCFVLAAILLGLAFLALIAERMVAALRPALVAEATALQALALLPVLALGLSAAIQIAQGAGITHTEWAAAALSLALGVIALELGIRALAIWFLPAAPPATARARIDSLLSQLVAGSLGQSGMASPIRAQLGLDFSRSWALRYLRAAALPAIVLTALFCWGLTGLVMIDLDQRGVYQRLGAPVAILRPGLNVILPWPIGIVNRVEFGAVHEIAIGGAPPGAPPGTIERADAEAPPPPSANRLWDQPHPGEVSTLIASETVSGDATSRQSFQIVNADIRVLYRVGLSDADALRAATMVADPASLVRQIAGRRIARAFAVRTLPVMLGPGREVLAEDLRRAIAEDLAPFASGIEIVAVVVEAIHPPAGAAAAYHQVQAAAIGSRTAVAEAQGRAKSAANETRQQVHQLADSATAQSAETVAAANADSRRFAADAQAHAAGGASFLLERYFADLVAAVAKSPLTILDARLAGAPGAPPGPLAGPVIDLRPFAAPAATPADDPD